MPLLSELRFCACVAVVYGIQVLLFIAAGADSKTALVTPGFLVIGEVGAVGIAAGVRLQRKERQQAMEFVQNGRSRTGASR